MNCYFGLRLWPARLEFPCNAACCSLASKKSYSFLNVNLCQASNCLDYSTLFGKKIGNKTGNHIF